MKLRIIHGENTDNATTLKTTPVATAFSDALPPWCSGPLGGRPGRFPGGRATPSPHIRNRRKAGQQKESDQAVVFRTKGESTENTG